MKWVSVDTPPDEGGRYWCYVEYQSDLGKSAYQWNCAYNNDFNMFSTDSGHSVTHWQPLPDPPA